MAAIDESPDYELTGADRALIDELATTGDWSRERLTALRRALGDRDAYAEKIMRRVAAQPFPPATQEDQ